MLQWHRETETEAKERERERKRCLTCNYRRLFIRICPHKFPDQIVKYLWHFKLIYNFSVFWRRRHLQLTMVNGDQRCMLPHGYHNGCICNRCSALVVPGCTCRYVAVPGCILAAPRCLRLYLAVPGYTWLCVHGSTRYHVPGTARYGKIQPGRVSYTWFNDVNNLTYILL